VEARHEFGNDPMKIMRFEHKTRMIDHRIKILKLF